MRAHKALHLFAWLPLVLTHVIHTSCHPVASHLSLSHSFHIHPSLCREIAQIVCVYILVYTCVYFVSQSESKHHFFKCK